LAEALSGKIEVYHLADAAAALARAQQLVRADDALLVKGSNAVGLAHVVAGLTAGGE
jgi:UDP-N-acetylmuramoyl-tripeptide--D-alanyl-D-alanine ligase